MQNDKIIKLIEDLGSAGYKIEELDCSSDNDVKILLQPVENSKSPFPKDKMIKIVEVLSSACYSVLKYGFTYEHSCGVNLVLRKLDKNSDFLEAVSSLPERKKNDGSGRAAAAVAGMFKVSMSTVYQARAVLRRGLPELVKQLRRGDVPVKTAYKRMLKDKITEPEQATGRILTEL
jgi:hypothetical protein